MEYKGYSACIYPDSETKTFKGKVIDINDALFFEANSFDELEDRFQKTIDSYLAFCNRIHKDPDKPFSGKLTYRTDKKTHRALAVMAGLTGKSINTLMESAIQSTFFNKKDSIDLSSFTES